MRKNKTIFGDSDVDFSIAVYEQTQKLNITN